MKHYRIKIHNLIFFGVASREPKSVSQKRHRVAKYDKHRAVPLFNNRRSGAVRCRALDQWETSESSAEKSFAHFNIAGCNDRTIFSTTSKS
uniref:Uncharacterized protein n=1 Tax=Romanomermis culicivorax TaxID=13658 RepID=A0A915HR93_ROMCU